MVASFRVGTMEINKDKRTENIRSRLMRKALLIDQVRVCAKGWMVSKQKNQVNTDLISLFV